MLPLRGPPVGLSRPGRGGTYLRVSAPGFSTHCERRSASSVWAWPLGATGVADGGNGPDPAAASLGRSRPAPRGAAAGPVTFSQLCGGAGGSARVAEPPGTGLAARPGLPDRRRSAGGSGSLPVGAADSVPGARQGRRSRRGGRAGGEHRWWHGPAGAGAATCTGPATFSGGGVPTIDAGKSPATRTGAAPTPASLILATMQQNTAGVPVQAA